MFTNLRDILLVEKESPLSLGKAPVVVIANDEYGFYYLPISSLDFKNNDLSDNFFPIEKTRRNNLDKNYNYINLSEIKYTETLEYISIGYVAEDAYFDMLEALDSYQKNQSIYPLYDYLAYNFNIESVRTK